MEILEKDLKRVAGSAMTIAMSSVTMDMTELFNRPNFKEDLNKFCAQENCEVVVIMTVINNEAGKLTRQIAVYSENRIFRDQIADTLDNSEDIDLDLELVTPPFDEISVFQQGNVTASRKKVLPILKSFLVGDTTPDVASKDFVSVHTVSMPTEGFTSVLGAPETSNVHFTLDSIDELSGRNSFEENSEIQEIDLLKSSTNSDENQSNNVPHKSVLDFDPLATITSLDEESPPKDTQNDSMFGNTQNPFGDFGDFANSNSNMQNAKEPSANFSSANLSSAHSSNIFDFGISDSELVDPFSSVDETGSQILPSSNPIEVKVNESGENEPTDADNRERNPFRIEGFEMPQDNTIDSKNSNTSNPFQNIVDLADDSMSNNVVNFQLNDCDNEEEDKELLSLEENSDYSTTTKTNPFSSGTFLEVDAYKTEHPLSYKSPSLIVECDEKSQADDLAELEESELFDKIPTPEIEHSGESSPFVMSGTGTPYEVQSEYHSRTGSDSGSGMPEMVVPPNSLMDQGCENTDRQLPSFNNAEMVEKIKSKKASLGAIMTEESAAENIDLSVPFTPANSFLDNSGENLMRDNSLPNLLSDSEMIQKVQQKRDSLQANLDFTETFDNQSNPFEINPFKSSNVEESTSSVGTTFTTNDNPFFQLDANTSDNMHSNQSLRGNSLDKTGSSDVFTIFGDTGGSNSTSLDNQVGSENGSQDLFDVTDFGTQSAQPSQSLNPFVNDVIGASVGTAIPSNQTVTSVSELTGAFDQENNVDQSILEVINNSANLEAADVVSESIAREIIHDAIEIFPDLKNPKLAESVLTNTEHEGGPIWTQQGSGDSGIGSTDSPQQAPKSRLQTLGLNSEVSVETEYLPGMDPLHGSLNIVTSPASQTHSIETDADKEVVEGESFRKISEAFVPEHSPILSNQTSLQQPDLTEQIREMIINRNINTTADNIQTSTSVDKVVSPDEEDTVVSLDKDNADLPSDNETKVVSADEEDAFVSLDKNKADCTTDIAAKHDIPNDVKPVVNAADIENDNCLDTNEARKDKHDVTIADLLGDFLGNEPVDAVVDNTQEYVKNDAVPIDPDYEMIPPINEESEKHLIHENVISTIISSGSDNSISSDSSSSFQSTSESELVTVRENTVKFSDTADTVLIEQPEEDRDSIETNKIMDSEGLENKESTDVDEDLMSKNDDSNLLEVADKLVKDTFAQVLEQEKARIFEGQESLIADNKDLVEESINLSDNAHSEMRVSCNEQSDVDKQFVVEKSDVVAEQTPVLINSLLTESALTIESISPVETPLEEHASGFYEVNPEARNKDFDLVGLSDSSYQTNLGENETGFYDFNNDNEGKENENETGSPKELVGIHMTSYEDNALKLNSVIDNDNKNFLMLDEDYSDASVSPLETPESEHVRGFYDINADNLELAIAKTESLNICGSLTAESTYSDSSMSPLDTPNAETVGGFYELTTSLADIDEESSVAAGKQLGPDDAPKINIELVDSPETSKDSFDSETESCFEETEEIKNEGIISEMNDEENVAKNRSVRFDVSTKFPEDMVKSTETVESQDSDIDGFYELNAELEGDLLQNIDVGNPFSPIESPNEDVFTLDYEINPCVPDFTKENSDDEEHIEERPKKSYVSFFNDVKEDNEKVEEMADFLVETALNEAISTLSEEKSELNDNHKSEAEPSCNARDHSAGIENEADGDIEEEELHVEKYENGLYEVADQLVEEAMSSAIEIVQEMTLDSEAYRDPVTGESNKIFSDSSDSETSSTTTEGSYRIDHSSELATPDRDGIAGGDLDINSIVDDFNNEESTLDENISTLPDQNVGDEIVGVKTVLFENTGKDELQTQYSEPYMEENKENIKVKTADSFDFENEVHRTESSIIKEVIEENEDANAHLVEEPHSLNDENGNITEEILHEHDISTEIDFDEEDTSRFDDDTNTSMDVKSPDGPSYYKYDSFELDDKEVSEKSKTLNRQGTIIPDIIISMDDSPPVVDETVKGSRRLGNYKPEIIDLSHETEDEVSEKDDSDNVSEASLDTNLVAEEIVQEVSSAVESVDSMSNIKADDVDKNEEKTTEITNKKTNDANKDLDENDKESPDNAETANMDQVKYHNVKDLESEKRAKKSGKLKGEVNASENTPSSADGKSLGQDEYVTRKEIFYTSAGRLSVSIDSVVDPPSEGEGETEAKPEQPKQVSEKIRIQYR